MLLHALALDWPRERGRPRHYDWRAAYVLAHHREGLTVDQLAAAFEVKPAEVRRLLEHAEAQLEQEADPEQLGTEPRIIATGGEPPRPAELARTPCPPREAELRRQDRERIQRQRMIIAAAEFESEWWRPRGGTRPSPAKVED